MSDGADLQPWISKTFSDPLVANHGFILAVGDSSNAAGFGTTYTSFGAEQKLLGTVCRQLLMRCHHLLSLSASLYGGSHCTEFLYEHPDMRSARVSACHSVD